MDKHKTTAGPRKISAYTRAGVNIDRKMSGLAGIKKMVSRTATKGVLSDIGLFGGLFASPGSDKVLVASTDGVGTKLKVAVMAKRHNTVGQDLVNHCVNDILVQGARPLFFLDYLGTSRLNGKIFREVISGFCKACLENNCALLGGETAEMPGLYPEEEYDLVGTIVGVADKKKIVNGRAIRPGDVIIGLKSGGLQTNGYSLARKVIFKTAGLKINDKLPGTRKTVAEALLAVHKSYLKPVMALMKKVPVHGMAHITGGGFYDNIPRVLPAGVRAVISAQAWKTPEIFRFIQRHGKVCPEEMYRVFNMGIGFVIFVSRGNAQKAMSVLKKMKAGPAIIGRAEKGQSGVILRWQ